MKCLCFSSLTVLCTITLLVQLFENCLGAALLGGHLKNRDSNRQTSNDESILENENQTQFEPFIPTDPLNNNNNDDEESINIEDTNDDLNQFPNHRISYGPLHQPKTYIQTKFSYPLISSSYASTKIQGNNKYKVVNGNKDRIITTHRFPQNDIGLMDLFPDYNSHFTIQSTPPTSTSTVVASSTATTTTSHTTTARSTVAAIVTTKRIPSTRHTSTISSLSSSSSTTTTTTTTPVPIATSTTSNEEADSLFNKFLMEIFQTTDFDNPPATKDKTYDDQQKEHIEEVSTTTTKAPALSTPSSLLDFDEHLYSEKIDNNDFETNNYQLTYNRTNNDEYLVPLRNDKFENLPANYTTSDEFVYVEYDDKNNPLNNYTYDYYIDDYEKPYVNLTSNTTKENELPPKVENFNKTMLNKNKTINILILNNSTDNKKSPTEIAIKVTSESMNKLIVSTERNILVELLSNENYMKNNSSVLPISRNKTIDILNTRSTTTPTYDEKADSLSVSLMPPIVNSNQPQIYLQEALSPPSMQHKTNYYHSRISSDNVGNMRPSPFVTKEETLLVPPVIQDRTQTKLDESVPNDTFDFPLRPLENTYLVPTSENLAVLNVGIPASALPLISENKNRTTDLRMETDKILSLNSQPMYHQLPTDLTPPLEEKPLRNTGYHRPPWGETRPPTSGHYHHTHNKESPNHIKRIPDENLPNILPQFRPNAKISYNHPPDNIGTIHNKHLRRPPPSPFEHVSYVRPVSNYYDKMQPPPPRQQMPMLVHAESKHDVPPKPFWGLPQDFSHGPPKVPERHIVKKGVDNEVSTLQMIKSSMQHIIHKNNTKEAQIDHLPPKVVIEDRPPSSTDFPLYVVYPTNHSALSFNIFNNDKSTVVVGKRGEKPIPPPLITDTVQTSMFDESQTDDNIKSVYHSNTPTDYPLLTDFPYPIERPNGTVSFKYIPPGEKYAIKSTEKLGYNTVSTSIIPSLNSGVVLGIGKEVPAEEHIAIAYSPTEPPLNAVVYPMPSVGQVDNTHVKMNVVDIGHFKTGNEFTVSAVMHTHSQNDRTPAHQQQAKQQNTVYRNEIKNHKSDLDVDRAHQPIKLDFQAPFQASVSVDSQQEHWSAIRNKNDRIDDELTHSDSGSPPMPTSVVASLSQHEETSTPYTERKEFDFENFKPQLFGGFKPIIKVPNENNTAPLLK